MSAIEQQLFRLGACREGREWAATQPSAETAWENCERADWMLWLLGRLAGPPHSESRRKLVACAADCAETSVRFIRDKGIRDQVRYGLALLRRYLRGESTLAEARRALNAAAYAAYAADADDAAAAADADDAAAAAYAADAAAYAAAAAADADDAAAAAYAADAAAYAARLRALKDVADIVRRHYPTAPELAATAPRT